MIAENGFVARPQSEFKQIHEILEENEDAVYADEGGTTLSVSVEPDGDKVLIDVKVYRKKFGIVVNDSLRISWHF